MRSLLVCLSLLFSLTATAQVSRLKIPKPNDDVSSFQLYPLGMEMRYERASSQDFETRHFLNFAFAYQKNNLSALFEYSKFNDDSGNTTSNIETSHQELILWGRWHFVTAKAESAPVQVSLYGGLGIGAYQDQVKTTLMGQSQTDESGTKVLTGLSFGGDLTCSLSKDFALLAALEGRTLFSGDFDPNPLVSGVARVGILLNLK